MPYFSRLTDIVTCSLTLLVQRASDQRRALDDIVREIQEGITGAERCVQTAVRNVERIESEIAEQQEQSRGWEETARRELAANADDKARQALFRKREVVELIAALEDQRRAAIATRMHMETMQCAIQARLADAQRRLAGLVAGCPAAEVSSDDVPSPFSSDDGRCRSVEAELAELRKSLGV